MANEFKVKNGLVVDLGGAIITGSVIATGGFTGSLQGTSSWAISASYAPTSSYVLNAVSSSFASTASYVLNAVSSSYAATASFVVLAQTASYVQTAQTASYVLQAVSASFATLAQTSNTASYVVTAQTASYVLQAVSASFASTASYVNTLNQSVLITGSLTIGSGSLGTSENTLTLGPRDNVNEGGQLGLNAPGGTYTSASFIDLYQNRLRILRGTNAGSTAEVANWSMHSLQMSLPAYNNVSAFPGTAVATLAVDSGGNVLTIAGAGGGTVTSVSASGTVSGITLGGGPITTSGTLTLSGTITGLTTSNLSATAGILNAQLANSSITIGSTGISLGGSSTTLAGLTSVTSTSFTGSLQGTSSWATTATQAQTRRINVDATAYIVTVDSDNSTPTAEILYTPTNVTVNSARGSLTATSVTSSFTGSLTGALIGTASYVNGAIFTSTNPALSSSYALTASYALNGGSGATFPYTGSAVISGSLVITGSLRVGVPSANNPTIDSTVGTLGRGALINVDWINTQLNDQSAATSVDWTNRGLYDSSGTNISIDWESRTLSEATNTYVALEYSSDAYVSSQLYYRNIIPGQVQKSLADTPVYGGQVIQATVDVTTTDFQLVYLSSNDGTWYPLKNLAPAATRMVGICVDAAGGYVLLEGDVGVSDDASQGAYVAGADHGLPVYVGGTNGEMTTTVPTSGVVRVVGHIYYQSSTDANWWTMKFRPSNDWYEI